MQHISKEKLTFGPIVLLQEIFNLWVKREYERS